MEPMFGKPQWFKRKKIGWGLTPVSWQGWLYTAVWSAVLLLPMLALVVRNQAPEAVIWLICSSVALVWDVRQTMQEMEREERKHLLFIGEEETEEPVDTQNFELRQRTSG